MRPPKPRRIVIAAYEGVSLLDLAGPLEAFQVASSFGGSRDSRVTYECSVVSIRGGPVKTANGVELVTKSVRSLGRDPIDTLIVPGAFLVDDVTRDRDLVHGSGRRQTPVGGYAPYVLAASFWPPLAFSTGGERLRTGCTRRCWRCAIPG